MAATKSGHEQGGLHVHRFADDAMQPACGEGEPREDVTGTVELLP